MNGSKYWHLHRRPTVIGWCLIAVCAVVGALAIGAISCMLAPVRLYP